MSVELPPISDTKTSTCWETFKERSVYLNMVPIGLLATELLSKAYSESETPTIALGVCALASSGLGMTLTLLDFYPEKLRGPLFIYFLATGVSSVALMYF